MTIFILFIAFTIAVSVAINYDLKRQKSRIVTDTISAENKALVFYGISVQLLIIISCL